MKREYVYILIVVLVILFLTLLMKPIGLAFLSLGWDKLKSSLIAGSVSKVLLLIFALKIIYKLKLQNFNGLSGKFQIQNAHALIIPFAIAAMGIFSNRNVYTSTDENVLILFVITTLVTGLAEESIFRGVLLPLFIQTNIQKQSKLTLATLYASLIFGLFHFLIYFKDRQLDNALYYVFVTFCVGCLLSGLFLRTGNILAIGAFHGLFNFAFSPGRLKPEVSPVSGTENDLVSLLISALLWVLVFAIGIYIIRLTDNKETVAKLGFE